MGYIKEERDYVELMAPGKGPNKHHYKKELK